MRLVVDHQATDMESMVGSTTLRLSSWTIPRLFHVAVVSLKPSAVVRAAWRSGVMLLVLWNAPC